MDNATTYTITNRNSGLCLGTYSADSEQGALDALARDAGYSSHAEACEVTGTDGSELDAVADSPSSIRLQALHNITPGDAGVLGATLDDCDHLGDDDTVDRLEATCRDLDLDAGVAYAIVHLNNRSVS